MHVERRKRANEKSEGRERTRRAKKESECGCRNCLGKAEGGLALQPAGLLGPTKTPLLLRYSCVHLSSPTHVFSVIFESFTLLICSYLFVASQSKSGSKYYLLSEETKSANMPPKAKKIANKKCERCRKDRQKVNTAPCQSTMLDISRSFLCRSFEFHDLLQYCAI